MLARQGREHARDANTPSAQIHVNTCKTNKKSRQNKQGEIDKTHKHKTNKEKDKTNNLFGLSISPCACMRVNACVLACMPACLRAPVHACTHMCMCMCARVLARTGECVRAREQCVRARTGECVRLLNKQRKGSSTSESVHFRWWKIPEGRAKGWMPGGPTDSYLRRTLGHV